MENSKQPIYPIVNNDGFCTSFDNIEGPDAGAIGLTKREYFAGLAMQGIISNTSHQFTIIQSVAHSIFIADELLKQLESK